MYRGKGDLGRKGEGEGKEKEVEEVAKQKIWERRRLWVSLQWERWFGGQGGGPRPGKKTPAGWTEFESLPSLGHGKKKEQKTESQKQKTDARGRRVTAS